MGEWIELTAADGHTLAAYRAAPASQHHGREGNATEGPGAVRGGGPGGVVVIQEVFGVNTHIRSVCERFAEAGFEAIAPSLFDRIRPEVELGYDQAGIEQGRALVGELGWERPLLDVRAAALRLGAEDRARVVGYCWGGTVAWLAACRLDIGRCAAYYGRQIVDFPDDHPRCATIAHFGADDALIPMSAVEAVRAANPKVPVYVYPGAGHGFNCDQRADYRADAAASALERTLRLFTEKG